MRKPAPPRDIPPPLELECLKALWVLQEGSVKDVRQVLAANRSLAYTTVMTVLDRLVRKGTVARRKVGRSYFYSPLKSRETLQRIAVKELLESFFDGSAEDLISYLRESSAPLRSNGAYSEPAYDGRLDTTLL